MTRDSTESKRGLLLVGHGTREPIGQRGFFATARLVADRMPDWIVEPCFLELAEPPIRAAVEALYRHGVREMVVVPALLFNAGHAQEDIPAEVATAAAVCPGLQWRQAEPLNCHRDIIDLSVQRFLEAIVEDASADEASASTLLVLVGRGSSDADARQEMFRFAELRRERTPVADLRVAFVAVCEPRWSDVWPTLVDAAQSRVVVQPHLLFAGQVADTIRRDVATLREQAPNKVWLFAEPLGPHALLASALTDRAKAASSAFESPLPK